MIFVEEINAKPQPHTAVFSCSRRLKPDFGEPEHTGTLSLFRSPKIDSIVDVWTTYLARQITYRFEPIRNEGHDTEKFSQPVLPVPSKSSCGILIDPAPMLAHVYTMLLLVPRVRDAGSDPSGPTPSAGRA